ncbi:hypothetical protein GQ42DRAFT_6454 [Ramicandelaber brevisporus]|nr:hypothetical protein GQ42DRAFT_6454 [Ramicandelaber brevisporus]
MCVYVSSSKALNTTLRQLSHAHSFDRSIHLRSLPPSPNRFHSLSTATTCTGATTNRCPLFKAPLFALTLLRDLRLKLISFLFLLLLLILTSAVFIFASSLSSKPCVRHTVLSDPPHRTHYLWNSFTLIYPPNTDFWRTSACIRVCVCSLSVRELSFVIPSPSLSPLSFIHSFIPSFHPLIHRKVHIFTLKKKAPLDCSFSVPRDFAQIYYSFYSTLRSQVLLSNTPHSPSYLRTR